QVAYDLLQAGGPWARSAAEIALGGTDDDVRLYVRQGEQDAAVADNRAAVNDVFFESDNYALRTAADTALNGSDADVDTFLQTRAYPGRDHDDRIAIGQIMTDHPGSEVTKQANAALA